MDWLDAHSVSTTLNAATMLSVLFYTLLARQQILQQGNHVCGAQACSVRAVPLLDVRRADA